MTNEEAIYFLKKGSLSDSEVEAERFNEAYNMAIKSLEAWEKVREEIKSLSNSVYNATEFNKSRGLDIALEIINEHLSEVRGD